MKFINRISEIVFSQRFFWAYFFTVILLITLPINTKSGLNHITVIKIRGDYFFHALTFLPWAFYATVMKKSVFWWLVLGLLFSTGTEMMQYLIPYRRFNINDMISNSIGILLGILFFILISKIIPIKKIAESKI